MKGFIAGFAIMVVLVAVTIVFYPFIDDEAGLDTQYVHVDLDEHDMMPESE